jgi:protease IV
MRESLLRKFFKVFFGTFAVMLAFVVTFMLFGLMNRSAQAPIEYDLATSPVLFRNSSGSRTFDMTSPVVLRLEIHGPIGIGHLKPAIIREKLFASQEGFFQGRTKAVILEINSPGGLASDSYAIYEILQEYKKRYNIPIYAHVEGVCASGAMMIACSADKIFANPSSITGSVGVIIGPTVNVYELMTTHGIKAKTLTAGKNKDALNPMRKWTSNEGASIQKAVDGDYDLFVDIVTTNRKRITKEALINTYGAHVFAAKDALSNGYIDAIIPSYEQFLDQVAGEVQLGSNYQVIGLRVQKSPFNALTEALSHTTQGPRFKITHHLQSTKSFPEELQGRACYLYMPSL